MYIYITLIILKLLIETDAFEILLILNAEHPEVVSVFPDQERQLHTSRSWEFMSLENIGEVIPDFLWKKARFGKDTITANLDSGN